ncbi:undecaprenyl-diphosphate phosphatase [Sandaracinobacter sp. RS1-74]|uniref:undecaprenyl-diphosphate phosphatase n=1 Tax=Sandaracinobacteroides sayramensis TaxID=2913411 RepID=UPI001EDBE0C6|nr:undecaprenyl-diphosphate phosphatase [Sandaracinobacteroides sayramensis]MCG2841834.1 undecaprenyl-diphosphate phosphatase [Sandaracinobacteroides sayramensis]
MDPIAILQAFLLGLLEGLTEFLPVSSTGHLILASELMGFTGDGSVAFKIAIQLGAILAVLVAYRQRFAHIAAGLVRRDSGAIAFTRNILLGFLPAMVVGFFAYSSIRQLIESPMTVAIALIVGGIAILLIEKLVPPRIEGQVETMPWRTALGVGVVQCIAMVPGVSRSGATIMGGLLMGLDRKTAAEFSFFLAVPTMAAATVYSLYKERHLLDADDLGLIAIGFVTAFVSALMVVRWLVGFVGRHGFAPFAWYRIALGSIALVWLLLR